MARSSDGVCGTSAFNGSFSSACKEDIARHFNHPEYAILRPTEFMGDLRGTANGMIHGAMAVDLDNLFYRRISFYKHHIGDCPFGGLT